MNWPILVLAGLFEIGWAIGLKYTDGFTRRWPTVGTVLAMAISLGLLGLAVKSLPVGTAYAVWVGVAALLVQRYSGSSCWANQRIQAGS